MATRVNEEWAVIRHVKSQAVIAKLGNYPLIPDDVAEFDDFAIDGVTASEIGKHDIDHSVLSDDELDLINQIRHADE